MFTGSTPLRRFGVRRWSAPSWAAAFGRRVPLRRDSVIVTNLLLRPLVRHLNSRTLTAGDVETHYTVEITCKGVEEAHIRSLLLHALSQAGLGLRRIDSEDIPDTPKVAVTAQAVAAKRNDGALEQIVGRLSLEPYVTAATWQVDRAILEALMAEDVEAEKRLFYVGVTRAPKLLVYVAESDLRV